MQVKTTMQKENPYINNLQKRTDAKWKNVSRSDKTTFQIVFGKHGRCVLWATEEKNQCKVQKIASGIV